MNILIVCYAERVKESAPKQKELEISEHHYAMQEHYYEQLRSERIVAALFVQMFLGEFITTCATRLEIYFFLIQYI